jgi:glycosyltransferase involved in cell wall biosynthesis
MRILIINDYSNMVGGTEKVNFSLKNALEKKGHIVEIFGSEKGENFASLFSRWYSLKWYNRTIKKIKEFKPDVVHVNNCVRVISPSVINASLRMKIPVVLTFHDLYYICPRMGGIYEKNRPKRYGKRHKCFYKSCSGFREEYKDMPRNLWKILKLILHRKIIKNNKINFASSARFIVKEVGNSLKINIKVTKWGTDVPKKKTNYKKNIIFVGELNEEKGLASIANAFNNVKGYKKFVLGKGHLKKSLEGKYKNLKFLGFQKPKEYYENASILVMPSMWQEPGGITVTEAMSYGICVVASDTGGIPEQITHMKTGLLFEQGNEKDFEKKLNYLLDNPREIKRMGRNARKYLRENCSSEKFTERYEKIYEEAIKKN